MRFLNDERGNLAITTSVVGLMLFTTLGAGMDIMRMSTIKQQLQSVTDSAALAAAMPERADMTSRKSIAREVVREQLAMTAANLKVDNPYVDVRESQGQVEVSLGADVPMVFGALMGEEKRRVSAVSVAEEKTSASTHATSISLVLDLSSSMNGQLDAASKLASVRSAASEVFAMVEAQFGSEAAAATQISTGVYPFNWGQVDGKTVALKPGTKETMDAMAYLSVEEGSVPTTAMEQALADQLADIELNGDRNRFIIYVTDGQIDEDKSDIKGQYLTPATMFPARNVKKCEATLKRIGKQQDKILREVDKMGLDGLLSETVSLTEDGLGLDLGLSDLDLIAEMSSAKHTGHDHSSKVAKELAKLVELREEYIEQCEPVQVTRVVETCEQARDNDISIIAINLSGDDGEALNTTNMCVFGIEDNTKKKKNKNAETLSTVALDGSFTSASLGGNIRVSVDGNSVTGSAETMAELREMMRLVMPITETSRQVRLIQ